MQPLTSQTMSSPCHTEDSTCQPHLVVGFADTIFPPGRGLHTHMCTHTCTARHVPVVGSNTHQLSVCVLGRDPPRDPMALPAVVGALHGCSCATLAPSPSCVRGLLLRFPSSVFTLAHHAGIGRHQLSLLLAFFRHRPAPPRGCWPRCRSPSRDIKSLCLKSFTRCLDRRLPG